MFERTSKGGKKLRIVPLVILAIMSCVSLGISIEKHGKSKKKENAWHFFIASLLQWGLILWMIL